MHYQGRHCRFLAGKDAIVAAISPAPPLPPLFSVSQNPAKDQALAALPPVAALIMYASSTQFNFEEKATKPSIFFRICLTLRIDFWRENSFQAKKELAPNHSKTTGGFGKNFTNL